MVGGGGCLERAEGIGEGEGEGGGGSGGWDSGGGVAGGDMVGLRRVAGNGLVVQGFAR